MSNNNFSPKTLSLFNSPKSTQITYTFKNTNKNVSNKNKVLLDTPELPIEYRRIDDNIVYQQVYNTINTSTKTPERSFLENLNQQSTFIITNSPAYKNYTPIAQVNNIQPQTFETQQQSIFNTPEYQYTYEPQSETQTLNLGNEINQQQPQASYQQPNYQPQPNYQQEYNEFKYVGKGSMGKVYINSLRPPHLIIKTFNKIKHKEDLLNLIKPLIIVLHQIQLSHYDDHVKNILIQRFHNFFVLPMDINTLPIEYKNRYDSKYGDNYLVYQNAGLPFHRWIEGVNITPGHIINTQFITMLISNFI
jgi:hypothetical protein